MRTLRRKNKKIEKLKKVNISIQVGSVEDIDGVLAYCAEHGIRACSVRAMLAATGRFLLRMVKRLTDIVFSLTLLLTLFPLIYIIMAIVVKRRTPGPAIEVEPMVRADGRRFGLFVFRMPQGEGKSIIARSPGLLNILMGHLSLFGTVPIQPENPTPSVLNDDPVNDAAQPILEPPMDDDSQFVLNDSSIEDVIDTHENQVYQPE